MPTRFGETQHGFLTPTLGRQAAFVGTALGAGVFRPTVATGVFAARKVRTGAQIYRKAVGPITSVMSAYSTVESVRLLRRGGYKPAYDVKYTPYDPYWLPPVPFFGAIPLIRPRLDFGAEKIQSRPGEHTRRTSRVAGPLKTRKSIRGASAPQRKSSTSSKKGRGSGARLRVSRGNRLRKSRRTVPWCRVHKKRHYCRLTRKR